MTGSPSSSSDTPIAVVTMVQARDFPTAWYCLSTLDDQLGPTRQRFVLLNDDRNGPLEASLAGLANTTVLAPGRKGLFSYQAFALLRPPVDLDSLIDLSRAQATIYGAGDSSIA
jgi:hypothetical protein